ncbi:hypothetical protein ABBQ32_003737 [Trebouxia sp. C0010 RCD-2024]
MGCGSSKPATKDATPIEKAASEPVGPIGARKKTSEPGSENIAKKLSPLPTSGLVPVEFGLVKGLEFGPKSAPALLVVQEWWGINEDIKEKAMMLHQRGGCRVFIPDIYKGKTTVEVAEAKHMYDSLNWPSAVQELIQASEYLISTGSPKVAAIGFCMGGALAIAASQYGKIEAAVGCYGLPQYDICPPHKVASPIQIHVGSKDDYMSVQSAEEFAAKVKGAGGSPELYIYEGAGHAFLNVPDKIGQAKASEKDIGLAWERIETFLWKHIGPFSSTESVNQSTVHQQNQEKVPSTAMEIFSEDAHSNRATNGASTEGLQDAPHTETTPSTGHSVVA